jgi:hypothetical protein
MTITNVLSMSREEASQAMNPAIGRLFRMMSRPTEEGDIACYYECERICKEAAEVLGMETGGTDLGSCRPGWNFGNMCIE